MLVNNRFEGKRYTPKGSMGLVLPEGWEAGWLNCDAGDKTAKVYHCDLAGVKYLHDYPNKYGPRARPNMAPALKPEIETISLVDPNGSIYKDPPRVHEGNQSIKGFKLYGTLCWWLLQRTPATPGNYYQCDVWAHAWARANEDPQDPHYSHGIGTGSFYALESDPNLNDDQINYRFRVGIDPYGGVDPFASSVVWGVGAHIYNVFHIVSSLEVMAKADQVTIFIMVDNLWGFVNSDAYIDLAELIELAPPSPSEPDTDYVVVVNLLPQDTTKDEKWQVLEAVHDSKQTILQSADDAKRLVLPGLPGSQVVVWEPERWTDDILLWLKPCATSVRRFL